MSYRIDWTEEAEDGLAAVWVAATDRDAVNAAVTRLEHALGRDPFDVGEARGDFDDRIAFEGPVGIFYQVNIRAREVVIVSVGTSGRKS